MLAELMNVNKHARFVKKNYSLFLLPYYFYIFEDCKLYGSMNICKYY